MNDGQEVSEAHGYAIDTVTPEIIRKINDVEELLSLLQELANKSRQLADKTENAKKEGNSFSPFNEMQTYGHIKAALEARTRDLLLGKPETQMQATRQGYAVNKAQQPVDSLAKKPESNNYSQHILDQVAELTAEIKRQNQRALSSNNHGTYHLISKYLDPNSTAK